MRSRIEDVAAAAGVSMKTVSRVLNHEPNVREETRQRVMQAVEALQYRPNLSARSLAGQRSYTVALVYNNPSRNYLMEVQGGMLEACRASHYNLVLAPVGAPRLRKAADLRAVFEHFAPDGVVLIPPLTDDATVLEYLEEHEVPFACIALGHHRIGHIKGPPAHGACFWRYRGYRQALKAAGIDEEPGLVVQGRFSFESGIEAAHRLLDMAHPPTAIFAANDDMAAGCIRVASLRGLRVPADLSICGFDDTPIARHIHPALTTVRQPTSEMGRMATMELLARIRSPDAGRMVHVEHEVLFRESTGHPPRAR
jgi:LacI family transcriptional regulator